MEKLVKYSVLLATAFVMVFMQWGCEKDIEIELKKEGDKKVIYSFIYPDSLFRMHYSKSVDVLSDANYKVVENARFKMYINGLYQGSYHFPDDKVSGVWDDFRFRSGDTVRIKALDNTEDTAFVETVIPEVTVIEKLDSVSSTYMGSDGILYDVLKCNLKFTDDPHTSDYYQLMIIQERWEVVDGKEEYYVDTVDYIKDDPVFYSRSEGTLFEGIDFKGLFDDETINGDYSLQCLVPSSYYKLYWFDKKIKLTFYLYHHTGDYYKYVRSKLISDYYHGIPIFEPINVYSNVKNGLGLVSGMSFDSDSLIFEQELP